MSPSPTSSNTGKAPLTANGAFPFKYDYTKRRLGEERHVSQAGVRLYGNLERWTNNEMI